MGFDTNPDKKSLASSFDCYSKENLSKILLSEVKKVSKNKPYLKRIYFAGPWFSDKGQLLHSSCRKIYELVKDKSDYRVCFPNDFHSENPKDCFDYDTNEICLCDALVALVDEKDVGTAWEIGMAYSLGKPIYLLGFDESTFTKKTNLMLAYTGKCFTFEKWAKFLTDGLSDDDYIDTNKNWEAIE